jgi:hypothetical protein
MSGEAAKFAYWLVTGVIGVLAFIVALVKALFVFALHVIIWLLIYIARAGVMLPLHLLGLDRPASAVNRFTRSVAQLLLQGQG